MRKLFWIESSSLAHTDILGLSSIHDASGKQVIADDLRYRLVSDIEKLLNETNSNDATSDAKMTKCASEIMLK